MALLGEQELCFQLLFSFGGQLRRYALFDQLKNHRTNLDHLLVKDVNAFHLHIEIVLIGLVVLELIYIFLTCLRVQHAH